MGDFNAKIEDRKLENLVAPYGLGTSDESGDHLLQFCQEEDIIITIT